MKSVLELIEKEPLLLRIRKISKLTFYIKKKSTQTNTSKFEVDLMRIQRFKSIES